MNEPRGTLDDESRASLDEAKISGVVRTVSTASHTRATRLVFIANLVLAFVPVGVFAIAAYERRWMHDDGFINLRIVRNVLEGHGPVYNIGERVEATTSPLWVMLLVAAGALGVRLEGAAVYGGLFLATLAVASAVLAAFRLAARDATRDGARDVLVPLGAIAFVALPVAWDFATSGLEMGLVMAWLAASFLVLTALEPSSRGGADKTAIDAIGVVAAPAQSGAAKWYSGAALFGLGWLIRPELALYGAALWAPLAYGFDARARAERRGALVRVRDLLFLLVATIALPGAYQIFRMGYYGALTANPAIAKEAFRANLSQGFAYFENFFVSYYFAVPLAGLAIFYFFHGRERRRRAVANRRRASMDGWVTPLLLGAALVHVIYIVAIGGDYMHGRMFLPAIFAVTLPVAMVPLRARRPFRGESWMRAITFAIVTAWAVLCAAGLRAETNDRGIGDERAWYARQAQTDNPIDIDQYRASGFYVAGRRIADAVTANCPRGASTGRGMGFGCRRVLELQTEKGDDVTVERRYRVVDRPIDPAITGVGAYGAIGIVGYMLPSEIQLVDRHGLADPVGARLTIENRKRPGHEKRLTDAWILARFTSFIYPEDAALTAARNALGCGRLGSLIDRVHAPLTWELFLKNIAQARAMQRLRVPSDPFEAEQRFCNARLPDRVIAGGSGGSPFDWHCPGGMHLVGLRGSINEHEGVIADLTAVCRPPPSATEDRSAEPVIEGPRYGEASEQHFDLACPEGLFVRGFYGRADRLVHQIGLICSELPDLGSGASSRTPVAGADLGYGFEVVCAEGARPVGVTGRSGALIDAAGLLCAPQP